MEEERVVISKKSIRLFQNYYNLINPSSSSSTSSNSSDGKQEKINDPSHDSVASNESEERDDEVMKKKILDKVLEIGNLAMTTVKDYRCIREGRFAVSRMATNAHYSTLLSTHNGDISKLKIIDIGCCFGTDIRQLLIDGASIDNITAIDQFKEFFLLGLELFDDKKYNSEFYKKHNDFMIESNFLDDTKFYDQLKELLHGVDPRGYYDVVHMGSVLHLLSEEDVAKALEVANTLLKQGGLYFGQTVGNSSAGNCFRNEKGNLEFVSKTKGDTETSNGNQTTSIEMKDSRKDVAVLRYLHTPDSLVELMKKKGFSQAHTTFAVEQMPKDFKFGFMHFGGTK